MELFFFQASLLIRILRQFYKKKNISYGHVTKIPRDDGSTFWASYRGEW